MADLPHPLSELLDPQAYDHPVARIEVVETHISWVLLTGEFAYKIKRPVELAFVDLRSPQRRAFFCHEEIRLNRRFSPDIYLDIVAVTVDERGRVRMGGDGRVIEHAVRMRQFDRAQELDRLLDAGAIETDELAGFGRDLAAIHAALPVATSDHEWGREDEIANVIVGNLTECERDAATFGTSAEVRSLATLLGERVHAARHWMIERRERGRVRELHGDLHARNILRRGDRLVAFDCIEFDPALRWIDVADEIAFLVADLEARVRAEHSHAFLNAYLISSGDYHACRVLDVYRAHRALVRAKVEALAVAGKDATARESARARHLAYVETARDALAPRRSTLILMSGLSGSGKTWLAERLARPLHALHLRSDIERRRLLGAPAAEEIGKGRYAADNVARVYQHLAQCAEDMLVGGYSVIVDATFRDRNQRARFRELASRLGVSLRIVHCRAPEDTLHARIDRRRRAGTDASEANDAVMRWQQERFDPILAEEGIEVIETDTTHEDAVELVVQRLRTENS